ncbi:MAG: phosphatase PAP2 family protein [Aequorivita sp.]|nr:phosphatase PAP2 family protein [Aequorivita sp.]
MINNFELDTLAIDNFRKVKLWLLIPPFLLLISFFLFFSFSKGTNFVDEYVESQKTLFYFLNSNLSEYPNLQFNLTQLGDALILYPLVIIFLFYAPRLWQALLTSSIITLIVSAVLKNIFAVPRPAAMFDNDSFVIVGKTLSGHTSLPSGHSMTAIMTITILLYAFMPKKNFHKIAWSLLLLALGLLITFSRVGVGAHYPFDVIIGGTIGYLAAIIGIKLNKNVGWLNWIKNKRFYPIFMLILLIWAFLIVKKIVALNLPIFYLSLLSLVITFFIITNAYVKRN